MAGTSSSAGSAPPHRSGAVDNIESLLLRLSSLAIRAGILLLLIAAVWLVYGIGTAPKSAAVIPVADHARFLSNFALVVRIFFWGVTLLAVGAAYEYRREEATGYALALAGAALYWGVPFAAPVLMPVKGPDFLAVIAHGAVRMAVACWIPGALVIAYDLSARISDAWSGRRKSRTITVPVETSKPEKIPGPAFACWQTDFCRPYVREVCPRFIERVPCWRRKEGCFCEEKIVFHAMELREGGGSFYEQMRKGLREGEGVKHVLTPAEKRDRCRRCPIYAQHQRLKYKALVPAAFAATFLILWLNAERIHLALDWSVAALDRLAAQLSFAVTQTAGAPAHSALPPGLDEALQSGIVYWGFMAFLTIVLLTWLLRLVEWLVFKVQV